VGTLRHGEHRSVPEIHRALGARGVPSAERSVTDLRSRYEELAALRLADQARLREQRARQEHVILARDGVQPDVGHAVLWVLRDGLAGEVLLARRLRGSSEGELVPLLREVAAASPVPLRGVLADGQESLRNAVRTALPGGPHQLCQCHSLREAAKPIFAADRHAKVPLKKAVRGVRPSARALAGRADAAATATRGYCLAVRRAPTDDGRPPLCAAGLRLHTRRTASHASLGRVAARGGARGNSAGSGTSSTGASSPPPTTGRPSAPPPAGSTRPRTCSRTTTSGRARPSGPPTRRCSPR